MMNLKLDIQRKSHLLDSEYLFLNPFIVVHIFNRGIFYESITQEEKGVNHKPLFIGDMTTSFGPFNLTLDEKSLTKLKESSFIGQQIDLSKYLSNITAQYIYSTKILLLEINEINNLKNAESLLKAFLLQNEIQNGLGLNINLLATEGINQIRPNEVITEYYLEKLLRFLIGRGTGLTPSGDDFIIGFLALTQTFCQYSVSNNTFNSNLLATLNHIVEHKTLTTAISHYFIDFALKGYVDFHLIALLDAISTNDLNKQKTVMLDIANYGHTSGIDLLTGVLFGLLVLKSL